MVNSIDRLIDICARNLSGEKIGICSVCSSHPNVIEASFKQCQEDESPLLIESTSNQVDQFGGYSGMRPNDFVSYIQKKAKIYEFDTNNLILGGDHLGPNRWRNRNATEAMHLAEELVSDYVKAGYRKIHLDASMPLGGDGGCVDEKTVAQRTASLCKIAEESFIATSHSDTPPVYVIGTEVPTPGGTLSAEDTLKPTGSSQALSTRNTIYEAFGARGLSNVWERVIGMVVQPGIEFNNDGIAITAPFDLHGLAKVAKSFGSIVFEAHSTDYQSKNVLENLVENHFAILKVGPWLTYVMREALYALNMIENELLVHKPWIKHSCLRETIEEKMLEDPSDWERHCHGDLSSKFIQRHFGLSDRVRYYWEAPEICQSIQTLYDNLGKAGNLSPGLIGQFLPQMKERLGLGDGSNVDPHKIVINAIRDILRMYHQASGY